MSLDCYADADFSGLWNIKNAHDPISVKSRSGYVIQLANCPILWVSKLQSLIALSTLESEYISLSTSLRDLLPLRTLLQELDKYFNFGKEVACNTHSTVYEDNNGALRLATVQQMTPRTKHINVIYHWFHHYVGKVLKIIKIESENQKANIFTKALDETTCKKIRLLLCGW